MFVVFDPNTGAVEQTASVGTGDDYGAILTEHGLAFLEADLPPSLDPSRYYVRKGVLMQREAFPATISKRVIRADGEDFTVVSGLPKPCRLRIDGAEHVIEDGKVELDAALPTTYRLSADHFPYLPWSMEIVAI